MSSLSMGSARALTRSPMSSISMSIAFPGLRRRRLQTHQPAEVVQIELLRDPLRLHERCFRRVVDREPSPEIAVIHLAGEVIEAPFAAVAAELAGHVIRGRVRKRDA